MAVDTITSLTSFVSNRRRRFDAKKKADLRELAFFRKTNKWLTGCPFYLEWPHTDIVSMCVSKYTDRMLAQVK